MAIQFRTHERAVRGLYALMDRDGALVKNNRWNKPRAKIFISEKAAVRAAKATKGIACQPVRLV